jgi:hypothetical protein
MPQDLTALVLYLEATYSRLHGDEAGQSEISYLLVVVGVIALAALIIGAVTAAVNGYLPKVKL